MRILSSLLACVFCLGLLSSPAHAYSSGAPDCMDTPAGSMGTRSLWGASAEGVKVEAKKNDKGDVIVTISGPAGTSVKGLSLMASSGAFDVSNDKRFKAIDCKPKGQVTQVDADAKTLPLSFTWKNTGGASSVSFVPVLVKARTSWAKFATVEVSLAAAPAATSKPAATTAKPANAAQSTAKPPASTGKAAAGGATVKAGATTGKPAAAGASTPKATTGKAAAGGATVKAGATTGKPAGLSTTKKAAGTTGKAGVTAKGTTMKAGMTTKTGVKATTAKPAGAATAKAGATTGRAAGASTPRATTMKPAGASTPKMTTKKGRRALRLQ